MAKSKGEKGQQGEELAAQHLAQLGYRIVERNFRVRWGEIDIVAEDKGVLVFVEVKTRTGLGFGNPAEAVTLRKRQQISRAALAYLSQQRKFDVPARFDVVTILLGKGEPPRIEVIANAFDLAMVV